MDQKEFESLINEAIANSDFERGLMVAISRYKDVTTRKSSNQRAAVLRLIRGFAGLMLEEDVNIIVGQKNKSDQLSVCDFCGKIFQFAKVTQSHSGVVICNACVATIWKGQD